MTDPALSLVVIRSDNLDSAERFYRVLGMTFARHSHGLGPIHLAYESNGCVFEIYPSMKEAHCTSQTRIGFRVANVDSAFKELQTLGINVQQAPSDSPWGRRAVVEDHDGHTIELISS